MSLRNASLSAFRKASVPLIIWALALGVLIPGEPMVSEIPNDASDHAREEHEAAYSPRVIARRNKRMLARTTTASAAPSLLPVVMQKDIRPEHQVLADGVLRALPSSCANNLKNFYVNYDPNNKNRGLGGASTIIISGNVPTAEFAALLIHECGHVVDLGGIRGTPENGLSAFVDGSTPMFRNDPSVAFYSLSWTNATTKKADATEAHFVSGYSASDAFEDFAETFAFYALQKREFARLAKSNPILAAKYNFMEQVVFRGSSEIASGQFTRGARAPWDVTLLPYEVPQGWHAKN